MPGVYEGGLKVWEASIDLVEYLASLGIGADCRDRQNEMPKNAVVQLGVGGDDMQSSAQEYGATRPDGVVGVGDSGGEAGGSSIGGGETAAVINPCRRQRVLEVQ